MQLIQKTREVDPFFEDAINQVFLQPDKGAFVMDGSLGLGKSSNFVMQGMYSISQLVNTIQKGNRLVRESKWAIIRESEQSSISTIKQLLGEAIFTPEIMALSSSPVTTYGSHPTTIMVSHDLPDGSLLEMRMECYGFNNEASHNRLRTHEFLGAAIFEMQAVPWNIFEVAQERCGRYRTATMSISKEIDGVVHTLTGLTKLSIVLCDVNIPERPHIMYQNYYDIADKSKLPYTFITPPSPLLYRPIDKVSKEVLEKYPTSRFEGVDVVWLPNPKVYNMTRHFEEKDEDGNNIPWTGYNYWYKRLHNNDSSVRRYVLGIPDTVGGASAVYKNFRKDAKTVLEHHLDRTKDVYVGFDPGGYAGLMLCQSLSVRHIHFFKEFIFEPVDRASCRMQFADFLLPWCRKNLKGFNVIIIPDPASTSLGKNIITGQEENVLNIISEEVRIESARPDNLVKYKIKPCMVKNQNVEARVNSLGYYVDKGYVTIDPLCTVFIAAMAGQYHYVKLKSGIISDVINKKNQPWADAAEAAQYPVVNILTHIKKARNANKANPKRGIYKIRHTRH